jgi:phosphatidylserine/phosphatidylglycerophosphate/cardiolipin synthase-like enzyme
MAKRLPKPRRVDVNSLPDPSAYRSLRDVWESLGEYRITPIPHGYPENLVRLWAPIDAVHEAIMACITQATDSVCSAMYGWTDKEINQLFLDKLAEEDVYVQLSLDATQAAGPGAVPLVRKWKDVKGNSLSLGHSAFNEISHNKNYVLDGVLTIGGSTNMSATGQSKQNNECYFCWDPVYAAETRARLDRIHDEQLMQMAAHKQKLVTDWASKKIKLTKQERAKLNAGLIPD